MKNILLNKIWYKILFCSYPLLTIFDDFLEISTPPPLPKKLYAENLVAVLEQKVSCFDVMQYSERNLP